MNTLPEHFFIGDTDGALYDTRRDGWYSAPLRAHYRRTFSTIESAAQFKATMRAGEFAWPGGYRMALSTADGCVLCYECAREEAHLVIDSIRRDISDGWRVDGAFLVDDCEEATHCDNCGESLF